jgi:hypothetical protein
LREKGNLLVCYVANNLDIATTIYQRTGENIPELSDEQETSLRLEEAALWNRIAAELLKDISILALNAAYSTNILEIS